MSLSTATMAYTIDKVNEKIGELVKRKEENDSKMLDLKYDLVLIDFQLMELYQSTKKSKTTTDLVGEIMGTENSTKSKPIDIKPKVLELVKKKDHMLMTLEELKINKSKLMESIRVLQDYITSQKASEKETLAA